MPCSEIQQKYDNSFLSWLRCHWADDESDIRPTSDAYWRYYFSFLALLVLTCAAVAALGIWGLVFRPEDSRYGNVLFSSASGLGALSGYISGQPFFIVAFTLFACFMAVTGAICAMLGLT